LIESWGREWEAFNKKDISNIQKGEILRRIRNRHNSSYTRTATAIDAMWRELFNAYRETIRAKSKTGQHTPSPKDLDLELLEAMATFLDGDPASEPVFEVDSLGPVGGEKAKSAGKDGDDCDDIGNEQKKKQKGGDNKYSVMKEMKDSTESFMNSTLENRKETMSLLRENTEIMRRNADTLDKLVSFLINSEK